MGSRVYVRFMGVYESCRCDYVVNTYFWIKSVVSGNKTGWYIDHDVLCPTTHDA